jgi:hypothetical protein
VINQVTCSNHNLVCVEIINIQVCLNLSFRWCPIIWRPPGLSLQDSAGAMPIGHARAHPLYRGSGQAWPRYTFGLRLGGYPEPWAPNLHRHHARPLAPARLSMPAKARAQEDEHLGYRCLRAPRQRSRGVPLPAAPPIGSCLGHDTRRQSSPAASEGWWASRPARQPLEPISAIARKTPEGLTRGRPVQADKI